jgi:hypothetical protein
MENRLDAIGDADWLIAYEQVKGQIREALARDKKQLTKVHDFVSTITTELTGKLDEHQLQFAAFVGMQTLLLTAIRNTGSAGNSPDA